MTIDQVETFLSVADHGSFKAASEVLNRSQPALSVSVKKLEEQLGVELFSREAYRPALTPAGRAFYHRAKDFFLSAKSLERFGENLGLGLEPELNMALDGLVSLDETLQLIRGFSLKYPDTKLNFSQEVLGGAADKVKEGMVQIAIGPNIGMEDSDFSIVFYKDIELVPVVPRAALESHKIKNLGLKELKRIPQVIVRDSAREPNSKGHGVLEGGRQWSVQDMQSRHSIILAGMGWGRLPKHMIEDEVTQGRLIEVELSHIKRSKIATYLIRSEHHPLGTLATELWNIFSAEVNQ